MDTGNMELWAADADDVESINEGLFYETSWISAFLKPGGTNRFLLVATKGYGKTLLLKAKRLRLEEQRTALHLLPEGSALADKPLARAPIFSDKDIEIIRGDRNYWEDVWLLSLTLCAMRAAVRTAPEHVKESALAELSDDLLNLWSQHDIVDATVFFANLLSFTPRQLHKCREDLRKRLSSIYKHLNKPIVIFIDNIDEYFRSHLEGWKPEESRQEGRLDASIWYEAQAGLARAIRALHGQNHHIKVYASIRREAFSRLIHDSELALQFEGSAVVLRYEPEDLKEIFLRNIYAEESKNLVEPNARDGFVRFLGRSNFKMVHPHVGEAEHIWDYILRHTLQRPRDLMAIGARLSNLTPKLRTRDNVRTVINEVSTAIAEGYLKEVQAHLDQPVDFQRVWGLLPSNILTRDQVRAVASAYNTDRNGTEVSPGEDGYIHPICALYKSGLLGYVTSVVGSATELEQKFELPGDKIFLGNSMTPPSDFYIVHPSLDAHVRNHSNTYGSSFNTLNIANSRSRWRDERVFRGVLKADIVGFSQIMTDSDSARFFFGGVRETGQEHLRRIAGFKN